MSMLMLLLGLLLVRRLLLLLLLLLLLFGCECPLGRCLLWLVACGRCFMSHSWTIL